MRKFSLWIIGVALKPVVIASLAVVPAHADKPSTPVTVQNPVTLNPETENPVTVLGDVTNPALQPFQQELFISTPEGLLGGQQSFIVPAGKRLVIEFVSFGVTWPTGQATTRVFIEVCNSTGNACPINYYLPASFQANEFGGDSFFVASSPTRLYADPGSEVTVAVRRNVTTGTGLATVGVSGHLVTLP
jgi:hypothetical protein